MIKKNKKVKVKGVLISSVLAITALMGGEGSVYASDNEPPYIDSHYGVSIHAETGEVIYEKGKSVQAFPASITKIMTSIMVEEHLEKGEKVEVSDWAAGQVGSNSVFRVSEGEKITKENAIKALMIMSGNDVAVAVAEHIAGSEREFAEMMDDRVEEWGLEDTSFRTASGLHDDHHVSTAYEMSVIAKKALDYPLTMRAMRVDEAVIKTSDQEIEVKNNEKIKEIEGSIGGKTGYTRRAGNTLTVFGEKNGETIISVVMLSYGTTYEDTKRIMEYSFGKIVEKEIVKENDIIDNIEIYGEELDLKADKSSKLNVVSGGVYDIETVVELKEIAEGEDIHENQLMGHVEVILDGNKKDKVELLSDREIEAPFDMNLIIVSGLFFSPVFLYFSYLLVINRKVIFNNN